MNNLDLSEIDPLKWAEVRRRVDVITSYLEIAKPKADDRQLCPSSDNLRHNAAYYR